MPRIPRNARDGDRNFRGGGFDAPGRAGAGASNSPLVRGGDPGGLMRAARSLAERQ